MATYREIRGLRVPYLDADLPPASASTQEGQVWYNSATGKLRAFVAYDTWATGGTGNTERVTLGGGGTQTAGWVAGGESPASPNRSALNEHYNGSGWSEQGDLNTARRDLSGTGTSTTGLAYAGYTTANSAATEEWDVSASAETIAFD